MYMYMYFVPSLRITSRCTSRRSKPDKGKGAGHYDPGITGYIVIVERFQLQSERGIALIMFRRGLAHCDGDGQVTLHVQTRGM